MDIQLSRMIAKALGSGLSRRAALRGSGAAVALSVTRHMEFAEARQATPTNNVTEGIDLGWYAAVRRSQFREGASGREIADIVRDGFVPIIASVPGFVAYYVIDTGQGEHVTVSIFDDPAGPAESSRRSNEWAPSSLGDMIEGPATVLAEGEVQVYAAILPGEMAPDS